jgi:hypothetical protein
MPGGSDSNVAHPQVGGKAAVFLFIITLLSFVSETQLTQVLVTLRVDVSAYLTSRQYVQTSLGYRQPYFILYVFTTSLRSLLSLDTSMQLHCALCLCYDIPLTYSISCHIQEEIRSCPSVRPLDRSHYPHVSDARLCQLDPVCAIPSPSVYSSRLNVGDRLLAPSSTLVCFYFISFVGTFHASSNQRR